MMDKLLIISYFVIGATVLDMHKVYVRDANCYNNSAPIMYLAVLPIWPVIPAVSGAYHLFGYELVNNKCKKD